MRCIENKFILKSKVFYTTQSIQLLKNIEGTKAFIVTDSIMETLGYLQTAVAYLEEAGISSVVFSEVKPDPDTHVIANGMELYIKSGADVMVALGGGSAIDAAKGILYFAHKADTASNKTTKKPLFIAIPSTSGTGSEVTNFSVITAEGEKIVIVDEQIAPDIAILDSTCIQHVPPRVIVDTGLDVLVHALEAYVSIKASDFTDALAEKAVQLIFENLEALYKDPQNVQAREHIQNASCMAGMAFTNANLGINHSLAHALGATFHLPHGRANALLVDAVMEYNAELAKSADADATARYAKLAQLLQLPARTRREGASNLIQHVKKLKRVLGIESSIQALGITAHDFESAVNHMAETALLDRCTPSNPRQPSKEELILVYKKCY